MGDSSCRVLQAEYDRVGAQLGRGTALEDVDVLDHLEKLKLQMRRARGAEKRLERAVSDCV